MVRTKKSPSSPPKGSVGRRLWETMNAKLSSSKSRTDSSQSQSQQSSSSAGRLPTARKRTAAVMEAQPISDADDDSVASVEPDSDNTTSDDEILAVQTARKSTAAEMIEKEIPATRQEHGQKVNYKAKDGTIKKRYRPGKKLHFS